MRTYSALIDTTSHILLSISGHASAHVVLSEYTPESDLVHAVNLPNYKSEFALGQADPRSYTEWTWIQEKRVFTATKPEALTDSIRELSRLTVAKRNILIDITSHLNQALHKLRNGLEFQETVYREKKEEALRFENSRDDEIFLQYPFLVQYADFKGISMREAADRILFKAKLATEQLAKTELLRLRYFQKVREAEKPESLARIWEEFLQDSYSNAFS